MSDYYTQHYGRLQGLTVLNVQVHGDGGRGEPWPVFIMGRDDGRGGIVEGSHVRVTLSRDAEGNGAGHAFIDALGI